MTNPMINTKIEKVKKIIFDLGRLKINAISKRNARSNRTNTQKKFNTTINNEIKKREDELLQLRYQKLNPESAYFSSLTPLQKSNYLLKMKSTPKRGGKQKRGGKPKKNVKK